MVARHVAHFAAALVGVVAEGAGQASPQVTLLGGAAAENAMGVVVAAVEGGGHRGDFGGPGRAAHFAAER